MKTAVSYGHPVSAGPSTEAVLAATGMRAAAYFSLTKPRIVLMVLITVGVGFLLAPAEALTLPPWHSRC